MALRKYKPMTAGTRWRIGNAYAEITSDTPEKSLLEKVKVTAGRNFQGRRAMRYMGGGHKKMYRIIDFKRDKKGVEASPTRSENPDCFPQIGFDIGSQHVCVHGFRPCKVKARILIGETKIAGGKTTTRVIGGIIDIGKIEMEIRKSGSNVILAPSHTLWHDIDPVIAALR